MRFILGASLALCGILLASFAAGVPPARAAASSASITILFDLGDGTYVWASDTLADPAAPNATWDAVLYAANQAGLGVRWSWYSCCGVFIQDIGNRSPPSGAVAIFESSLGSHEWSAVSVGISSLVLGDGDAIALSDNGFDPVTYGPIFPVPTPENPYPATEFRQDASGSGSSPSDSPAIMEVAWDHNLNLREIPASPAVAYGRVYVLTLDGLFALEESQGTLLWADSWVAGLSTPAVFNGTLIFGGRDGKVHAVNATDGREVWNTTLIAQPGFSGITSSPKLFFDTIYIGTFNESGGSGEVVALQATTGTVLWRHPAPASVSFSSPAVADGRVIVGIIGRYNTTTQVTYDPPYGVLALDATTGSQLWFAPTADSVAASPALSEDWAYVPSKDGRLRALDVTNGSVVWSASIQAGVSSPAVVDGLVITGGGAFGSGGRVVALNASSGTPAWAFQANGPVQSSIACAGRQVLFTTNAANGTIYALNATSGVLSWRYTPSPAQFIFATPAVADGRVFAPSDNGHVYAFRSISVTAAAMPDVINVTVPVQLEVGQESNVSVKVSAPFGTWDYAALEVLVAGGLDIVSTGPVPGSINGRVVSVNLAPVIFQSLKSFNVTVRANASGLTVSTGVQVILGIKVAGSISRFNPWTPTTRIVSATSPSGGIPTEWVLAPIVAAIAIVVAAVVILNRRRRSRGP